MNTHAAEAVRADARAHGHRRKDYWSTVDDDTFVRGLLNKNDRAWLELLYRIERLTTERIHQILRRRCRTLCSQDVVDSIQRDVQWYIDGFDKMRPLRAFDSRHGTLDDWICRLADQMTMRRIRQLTVVDDEKA